jgi:hypothetical protein
MMKKYYALVLGGLLAIVSGLSAATLTDAEVKKLKLQSSDLLSGLVSGHNLAFGKDNLYKGSLDVGMWDKNISNMEAFVTKIINENTNFVGMKDSTLVNARDKIKKANMDLINTIKAARATLNSPANLAKQVAILKQIESDMLAVQKTLTSPMTSLQKDEARKLLNSAAMFIETTAKAAVRHTTLK